MNLSLALSCNAPAAHQTLAIKAMHVQLVYAAGSANLHDGCTPDQQQLIAGIIGAYCWY